MSLYNIGRRLLFCLPSEAAHTAGLAALQLRRHVINEPAVVTAQSARTVMGLQFPNPIGLAAGLDKNADYIDALATLGFGFIEVGTVTPRPQPGNPKPRLFRLPQAQALINRMGFNNKGLEHLVAQVSKKKFSGILGINIGKNFDTPVERAVADYLIGLRKVYAHADYITVNISSPNTPGLRELQYGDTLKELLERLKAEQARLASEQQRYVPLAVKIAPDLAAAEIEMMAAAFLQYEIDCVIATNTTAARTAVTGLPHADETGGLSGAPLTEHATAIIQQLHQALGKRIPIIGVGGIMSGADAAAKIAAGASLVQVYTGLIYRGPVLVRESIQQINELANENS